MIRMLVTMLLAVILVVALASPAMATVPTGRDFGEHHSTMAQEMQGFTGEMNPGMHRGFNGWPDHTED